MHVYVHLDEQKMMSNKNSANSNKHILLNLEIMLHTFNTIKKMLLQKFGANQ